MASEKHDGCIREENKRRAPLLFTGNCSPGQRSACAVVHASLLAMHIAERTTKGWAFPSADGHSSEVEILSQGKRWQLALHPWSCVAVCADTRQLTMNLRIIILEPEKNSWELHKAEGTFILLYNFVPNGASHDCHQPQFSFLLCCTIVTQPNEHRFSPFPIFATNCTLLAIYKIAGISHHVHQSRIGKFPARDALTRSAWHHASPAPRCLAVWPLRFLRHLHPTHSLCSPAPTLKAVGSRS